MKLSHPKAGKFSRIWEREGCFFPLVEGGRGRAASLCPGSWGKKLLCFLQVHRGNPVVLAVNTRVFKAERSQDC